MRPMGTVAYRGKGQGKGKGRGEGRLGQGGRGRSKGGEKLMGTTAYGGKGSKGRAANGDRPVGAASCRRDHHTMASCQNPHPSPPAHCCSDPTSGGVFFSTKTVLTPTCIPQSDQRDVAIISKYICWGALPPSFKERKGSELRSGFRRHKLQTRTTNPRRRAPPPPPTQICRGSTIATGSPPMMCSLVPCLGRASDNPIIR